MGEQTSFDRKNDIHKTMAVIIWRTLQTVLSDNLTVPLAAALWGAMQVSAAIAEPIHINEVTAFSHLWPFFSAKDTNKLKRSLYKRVES